MYCRIPVRVLHLVDAMAGNDRLWGKEIVVAALMREQRASGAIDPVLVTFAPCALAAVMEAEGFRVERLAGGPTRGAGAATFRALRGAIRALAPAVIHSHGYRANIVARVARFSAGRKVRLISTCHGWVDTTRALRLYNALDRWTAALSDVTTVPDPRMREKFPLPARTAHVANGVPEHGAVATQPVARAGAFVAGTLGRVCEAKGILDVLEAAHQCPEGDVVFAIAGEGELEGCVREAGANVRYLGFFDRPDSYLASLDVYVQASHAEGLSLALLEAMRAGKAIVATDVGATRDAVADRESALLIPSGDAIALSEAVVALRRDPALRTRLGRNARARFESDFVIARQHREYLHLYSSGRQQ